LNYSWESTEAGAIGMQLTGFGLLVTGNFIYNKIIVLDWLAVNEENEDYKVI
jgi:hypothetical protein